MLKRLFGKQEEKKEVEETLEEVRAQRDELSTLVAGISDAILAVDRDGAPLFYNGQFAVLVGPEGGLAVPAVPS